MPKRKKDVLYRVVKFKICPDTEQQEVLLRVSVELRRIWNAALRVRQVASRAFRAASKESAEVDKKAFQVTLFDQINALTPLRKDNTRARDTMRNWQEETLDQLDASYKSFFQLRKNGDEKARSPRFRRPGRFYGFAGRSGFKVKGGVFCLSNKKSTTEIAFPLSSHAKEKLATAEAVKKFTLYCDRDGQFWVSLAYEIPQPAEKAFEPARAVYLALGATWVGVVFDADGARKSFVLKLWRPDLHWRPRVQVLDARIKHTQRGSRKHKKLSAARRRIFQMMSNQQRLNHREVVQKLLKLGDFFVVQDLTLRLGMVDGKKPDRKDLNWGLQNTGSVAELVSWLEEKVKEQGGRVFKCSPTTAPAEGKGKENKIAMAERLRDHFLSQKAV